MSALPTGTLPDESNDDYHANDAVSHSKLEVFARRPALFKRKYIDKAIREKSQAHFTFGSAFHTAVLEPELFANSYVEQPVSIKVRRGGVWDEFAASVGDAEILTRSDMGLIDAMQAAVCGNPYAVDLISSQGAIREASVRTGLTEWGCALQCRPDVTNPTGCDYSGGYAYNADVKTVESFDKFDRQFFDFGYYRQQPFYKLVQGLAGAGAGTPVRFFYIVVEKQEPFGCAVLEVDTLSFNDGEKEVRESLAKLQRCYAEDSWPNIPMVGHIGLPEWRVNQITAAMEASA